MEANTLLAPGTGRRWSRAIIEVNLPRTASSCSGASGSARSSRPGPDVFDYAVFCELAARLAESSGVRAFPSTERGKDGSDVQANVRAGARAGTDGRRRCGFEDKAYEVTGAVRSDHAPMLDLGVRELRRSHERVLLEGPIRACPADSAANSRPDAMTARHCSSPEAVEEEWREQGRQPERSGPSGIKSQKSLYPLDREKTAKYFHDVLY